MPEVLSSVSFNLDENILAATLPLFEAEKIEAIEWSFDTLYKHKAIPGWFTQLLKTFADNKRLVGHGVYFSLFSGSWSKEQQQWLANLEKVCNAFQFDHISEHFGFMTGANFHHGAPVSIPFTPATLSIGRDRLKRIYNSCKCPVGLENLAFSYSLEEVKKHGDFLDQLVSAVNGFVILDLHNVYCQSHNFKVDLDDIIDYYPLHLVREIHISGGSFEESHIEAGKKIRRDTHDNPVPPEVFYLLRKCIHKCVNLRYVVMEQLSLGLDTEEKRVSFRDDFIKMKSIVNEESNTVSKPQNDFLPKNPGALESPIEDKLLSAEQSALSKILETASSYAHAQQLLRSSILSNTAWQTEKWEPHMLETAIAIAQKWKHGFA